MPPGKPFYAGYYSNGTSSWFESPVGLTLDSAGNLFVADYYSSVVRKISSSRVVTTVAGNDYVYHLHLLVHFTILVIVISVMAIVMVQV